MLTETTVNDMIFVIIITIFDQSYQCQKIIRKNQTIIRTENTANKINKS
jgi:hypothetical protein